MKEVNISEILKILPHRYPFLLVDRIEKFEEGKYILVRKNVSFNEPFFQGHFPSEPVMPGVLILEAMAQACALYVALVEGTKTFYFLSSIEKARFRKPVFPGDSLIIRAEPVMKKMGVWMFSAHAEVNGERVAECEIKAAPRKEKNG